MKEIKSIAPIYLETYGITVNPYLTYGQIQQIVNSIKPDQSWAERQQKIETMVLYYATDITKEDLDSIDFITLLESGLVDAVLSNIKNIGKIFEAIEYTESLQRALGAIAKDLPRIVESLQKVGKKNYAHIKQ